MLVKTMMIQRYIVHHAALKCFQIKFMMFVWNVTQLYSLFSCIVKNTYFYQLKYNN